MNKRASRYIKPEKLRLSLSQEKTEDPNPPDQCEPLRNLENQQRKSVEEHKSGHHDENSKIFEKSKEETSFSSDDDEEEEDVHPRLSAPEIHSQEMLSLSRMQSMPTNAPRTDRAATHGRHRASTFDPNAFKRMKAGKIDTLKPEDQIELAILILQKEFEERTSKDITFLVKCTENVGFFKKYDEETHRECLAKMYHVHLKQGDPCINFGEFGETFWVTLKGKVGILVPIEKEITDKNGQVRKEKVLTRVAGQGEGYAFGELALLERKPRAATIICEEDCDFAVLDKAPFQQILLEKEEKRLFAEVNFLKSLKIFSQWAYSSIRSLFMYSHLRSFMRNQVVCRQSEPAECMFIVRAGEFKVSYKANYENKDTEETPCWDGIIGKYMRKKVATRDVEFSILGPGEIIGVEELLQEKPRVHTVVCESQTGLILQITKKEAQKLIFNEASAKIWLQEYLASKSKVQFKRVEHIREHTRKFQPLLMRTVSESPKKPDESLYPSLYNEEAAEHANSLRYYRKKRPENQQRTLTLNSQRDFSSPRMFGSTLQTEPDDYRAKDTRAQLWPHDGWSSADRLSMLETTVQATDSTIAIIQSQQQVKRSPQKRSTTQSSTVNSTKAGDDLESFRLSITEKNLKDYNDSLKLRRSNKEDRFSKLVSKPTQLLPLRLGDSRVSDLANTSIDSQSRSARLRESIKRERGGNPTNMPTLSCSPNTSKQELNLRNSAESLSVKSFHLQLHQAFPSLPANRLSLDSKSPSKTSRIQPTADSEAVKNNEFFNKTRKELIERMTEIKERLNLRERLDRDLFLASKRNTQAKGGVAQTFYNRAIMSSFSSNYQSGQLDSPLSLRLRERLTKIQKKSDRNNDTKEERAEHVESMIENFSSIMMSSNLLQGTATDCDSPLTPFKGPLRLKQSANELQCNRILNQDANSNSPKSALSKVKPKDDETAIKVTDRFSLS